ncbi:DUF1289 domain-containing protein [Alteromonas sp. ASW11-36]|uniref:DUF1289 domain-containing protein n=1 Tax=Alteromonas arenosi TaxID=3055817 RepID=A0ABT7STM9_9ALTE|nr:DUF1289 domain-containing protein [Alteromonas sp. ASW11-36]MDM7859557.1 DUF1289 domain-containing protein [Alteromonas sp. ASW11-36]
MAKKAPNPQLAQLEFFDIPSPCVGVCEANERGFCKGCFRSREERIYWPQINDAAKRIIIQQCQRRARAARAKKAGQSVSNQGQGDLFGDDMSGE